MTHPGQRELNVTIVNCPPDHNKGACAIAWGLIDRLQRSELVDGISILSLFREISPEVDYRHLVKRFPDLVIHRSPMFNRAEPFGFKGQWIYGLRSRVAASALYAPYVVAATLGLRSQGFRRRLIRREAGARALVDSDLVLDRGGPFFTAVGPPPNPTLLAVSWPFTFAREADTPYGVIGESVGPLRGAWGRRYTRALLEDARLIGVREHLSRETLMAAGISDDRITTMLDNAFWVQPRQSQRVKALLSEHGLDEKRFLAVTCRPWPRTEGYVDELARTIDQLVPSMFEYAVLVPNMYDPAGLPHLDDRAYTRLLFDRLTHKDRVFLIEEDLAPDELASLYGSASLVLGTRLHSVILGLVGGAPVVAVSYAGPKTRGVMALLGLSDYVLDMQTFDRAAAIKLAEAALSGQATVAAKIERLRAEGDALFRAFLQQVVDERR